MVRVTDPGAYGKANVGISNDKKGEIPFRRKNRGFPGDANQPGVSRVLSLSRMAKAMADAVNIPQLAYTVMWRRSSDTATP